MKIVVDTSLSNLVVEDDNRVAEIPLFSTEAFDLISKLWLRVGWNRKYSYAFSWLGRPIIQLPEDMIRIQEIIYRLKPDVIVETGIAHGGSLIFYASLLKLIGKGKVVGIDVEIRPHNRRAIEAHELAPMITLIEGSSIEPHVVEKVRAQVPSGSTVMVVLDSNHTRDHVRAELEAYSPLVSDGSYIVVCDGVMADIAGDPRTAADWKSNNPRRAAEEFASEHAEFIIEDPQIPFNESLVQTRVTYWPGGFLKRIARGGADCIQNGEHSRMGRPN